jgi:hypothetical protein
MRYPGVPRSVLTVNAGFSCMAAGATFPEPSLHAFIIRAGIQHGGFDLRPVGFAVKMESPDRLQRKNIGTHDNADLWAERASGAASLM